jgi:hypothetical protein
LLLLFFLSSSKGICCLPLPVLPPNSQMSPEARPSTDSLSARLQSCRNAPEITGLQPLRSAFASTQAKAPALALRPAKEPGFSPCADGQNFVRWKHRG